MMALNTLRGVQVKIVVKSAGQHIAYKVYTWALFIPLSKALMNLKIITYTFDGSRSRFYY